MGGLIKINSDVPFGQTLYTLLYLQNLDLNKVVRHSTIESRYLAWETVRKAVNPYFLKGTGFEGYLLSRCPNAEAALEAILGISQNMLDGIARSYRYQPRLRSRLMKTLNQEIEDPEAIRIWSSYLGAELGKLRAQILNDRDAQLFRDRTYKIVHTLPPMVYREADKDVLQTYAIGTVNDNHANKLYITPGLIKPGQQDAWMVAENIGEFGHPLVRTLLDRAG